MGEWAGRRWRNKGREERRERARERKEEREVRGSYSEKICG